MSYWLGILSGICITIVLGIITNLLTDPVKNAILGAAFSFRFWRSSSRRRTVNDLMVRRRRVINVRYKYNRDNLLVGFAYATTLALSSIAGGLFLFFVSEALSSNTDSSLIVTSIIFRVGSIIMTLSGFIVVTIASSYFSALFDDNYITKNDREIRKLIAKWPPEERQQIEEELNLALPKSYNGPSTISSTPPELITKEE